MPFCPKCWKEYPKGFATCEVCELPLTQVPPEGHKHEEKPKSAPKPDTSKKKK